MSVLHISKKIAEGLWLGLETGFSQYDFDFLKNGYSTAIPEDLTMFLDELEHKDLSEGKYRMLTFFATKKIQGLNQHNSIPLNSVIPRKLKTQYAQDYYDTISFRVCSRKDKRSRLETEEYLLHDTLSTLYLNIPQVLVLWSRSAPTFNNMVSHIISLLRHELIHAEDTSYNYLELKKDTQNLEYTSRKTEQRAWVETAAESIINKYRTGHKRIPDVYTQNKFDRDWRFFTSSSVKNFYSKLSEKEKRLYKIRLYKNIQKQFSYLS